MAKLANEGHAINSSGDEAPDRLDEWDELNFDYIQYKQQNKKK